MGRNKCQNDTDCVLIIRENVTTIIVNKISIVSIYAYLISPTDNKWVEINAEMILIAFSK